MQTAISSSCFIHAGQILCILWSAFLLLWIARWGIQHSYSEFFGRKINAIHPPTIPPIPLPGLDREMHLICSELSHMYAIFSFFFMCSKKFCSQLLEDSLKSTFLCVDQVLIVYGGQFLGWLSRWRNHRLKLRIIGTFVTAKYVLAMWCAHHLYTLTIVHLLQHSYTDSNPCPVIPNPRTCSPIFIHFIQPLYTYSNRRKFTPRFIHVPQTS